MKSMWRYRCENRYLKMSLHKWHRTCGLFLWKEKEWEKSNVEIGLTFETQFYLFRRRLSICSILCFSLLRYKHIHIKEKHPQRDWLLSNKQYTGACTFTTTTQHISSLFLLSRYTGYSYHYSVMQINVMHSQCLSFNKALFHLIKTM